MQLELIRNWWFPFLWLQDYGWNNKPYNDKSIDINFTVKEEQLQHIKFAVSQTLFKTFFNEKVENKKLLAKKMFKTKLLCTYNKEDKYVINMENASESQETSA